MKEITIVGGGLSGLSLGIALRRQGVPVRIFEAGTYPRHRVCGEFINGVTGDTLEALGIEQVFDDVRRHHTTQWFHHEQPLYRSELEEPALGISRYALDQKLVDLFLSLGGEITTTVRKSPSGETGEVWAAGRKLDRKSRWLGLKVHVMDVEMAADLEMHLGTHAYVGLAPVEGNRVNVCGLFRKRGTKGGGVDLLWSYLRANGLSELSERLQACPVDERSFLGVSAFHLGKQAVDPGLCALGDADRMIPPFTGNGMSMAFEAAEAAIQPLSAYSTDRWGWPTAVAEIRGRLQNRFRRRQIMARVVHPVLFSGVGRSILTASASSGVLPFRSLSRMLK